MALATPSRSHQRLKTLRSSFHEPLGPQPSVFNRVQACRLPGFKSLRTSAAAPTTTRATETCIPRHRKSLICALGAGFFRGCWHRTCPSIDTHKKLFIAIIVPGCPVLLFLIVISSHYLLPSFMWSPPSPVYPGRGRRHQGLSPFYFHYCYPLDRQKAGTVGICRIWGYHRLDYTSKRQLINNKNKQHKQQ